MKYCIFDGAINEVKAISDIDVLIIGDFGEQYVKTGQILLIPEEYISEVDEIKEQIQNLRFRLSRLDDEYYKKSEALRELYIEARDKENKIISRILKSAYTDMKKSEH